MVPVQIQVIGAWAKVFSPYAARDILRAVPVRSWNAEEKCWVVPTPYVAWLVDQFEIYGMASQVHGDLPQRQQAHASSWAEAMFRDLPQRLHSAAYKAMAKVLHPDTGGDDAAMKQLNDARGRASRG